MRGWKEGTIQSGHLISSTGPQKIYQLSGSLNPTFHSTLTFDSSSGEFPDFRLLVTAQHTGKAGANGRETDLGPAPMAIAPTLYKP